MADHQKPYNSLNEYYQKIFGQKVAKISIDGGFTCPNRDGTIATEGCIFCSPRGSGDFTLGTDFSISQQIQKGKEIMSRKWKNPKFIAYFQAFTNTYAPIGVLDAKYKEAISQEGIVGLAIATRPDCMEEDVLALLASYQKQIPLWVELGLQTSKESTAHFIHRGYSNAVFEKAVFDLAKRNIPVVVHVILGLPHETREDMLETIDYLNHLPIHGIKLQLLHVLKDTPLASYYQTGAFSVLEKEEYLTLLCDIINRLRSDIVIHRLTGDGPKESLIAPLWSLQKREVLNSLHKKMKEEQCFQGKNMEPFPLPDFF